MGDNGNIIGGEGNFITITWDSNIFDLSIKHFGLQPMTHGGFEAKSWRYSLDLMWTNQAKSGHSWLLLWDLSGIWEGGCTLVGPEWDLMGDVCNVSIKHRDSTHGSKRYGVSTGDMLSGYSMGL